MIDTKSPLKSVGLAGAVATTLVGVGQLLGYAIEPADARDVSEAIFGLVTVLAGGVAAVGRIRAKQRIGLGR